MPTNGEQAGSGNIPVLRRLDRKRPMLSQQDRLWRQTHRWFAREEVVTRFFCLPVRLT
jgi:hypothetical protein